MPQIPRLGLAGISGVGQNTPAAQALFTRAGRTGGVARSKPKRKSSSKKKRRVSASGKRKASTGGKRKYNSAAWMAKIRKMRKK